MLKLDSYKRKEETRAKEIMAISYNRAALTADFIGLGLNGKRLPTIEAVFPSLASDPEAKKEQEKTDALRYKMRFMNWAMNANAQRAKQGGATTQ